MYVYIKREVWRSFRLTLCVPRVESMHKAKRGEKGEEEEEDRRKKGEFKLKREGCNKKRKSRIKRRV